MLLCTIRSVQEAQQVSNPPIHPRLFKCVMYKKLCCTCIKCLFIIVYILDTMLLQYIKYSKQALMWQVAVLVITATDRTDNDFRKYCSKYLRKMSSKIKRSTKCLF